MERKSAKDWRKAHGDARAKVTRIETQITARLLELVTAHPEVPVETEFDGTAIKAKSLDTTFISHIDTNTRLKFIESIEKYLADQHPHKQLNLYNDSSFYDDDSSSYDEPVCNCDGDGGTYLADGEWWCVDCGLKAFK